MTSWIFGVFIPFSSNVIFEESEGYVLEAHPNKVAVISISISISNPCHNTKTNLSQHNDPILSKMVPGSCFVISIANFYKVLRSTPD